MPTTYEGKPLSAEVIALFEQWRNRCAAEGAAAELPAPSYLPAPDRSVLEDGTPGNCVLCPHHRSNVKCDVLNDRRAGCFVRQLEIGHTTPKERRATRSA